MTGPPRGKEGAPSSTGASEVSAGAPTCTLIVARDAASDARDREVVVALDGVRIATLMFGETLTRAIPAGKHRLRLHNTLVWKTAEFELEAGETAAFTVSSRPGRGTLGLLSILGARPLYLDLTRTR